MNRFGLILLMALISLMHFSCKKSTPVKIDILLNWQFRQTGNNIWLPAKVPGCVHTDLLNNKKIDDPYFGNNEQKLQWIEKENWEYLSSFNLDENVLENHRIDLVFEGLDTYAKVFLNDSLLLSADNMFRAWTINCKPYLKAGENKLLVRFISPVVMDSINAAKISYKLPDNRAFSRKAPYQYGWDWGPRFVTSGIWKPVHLKAWNEISISDAFVSAIEIKDAEATIMIEAEIEATEKQSAKISFQLNEVSHAEKINLQKGINSFKTKLSVPDPKLWWPNGMGNQPLYQLHFQVESTNSVDSQNVIFGIRQIELVQQNDSIGESFYFKINGKPFFAKGANYIPQDNFPVRVTDEKYIQTIQTALDANMNMLRVWGGGIYEKDIFYELCDKNGILVWQDFMFACTMYPGDSSFIENVRQEAIYQVKRLRNHPSIALWCGNNEVDEGWHNWGWQKALNYSVSDSTGVWNDYLNIFEEMLPVTVSNYSPLTPYIPSSPQNGWGRKESLTHGDMHYWGVWWGAEPFEIYEEKVGRFMSEFGFQGFPDLKTLDSCLLAADRNLLSPALLNHQKHPRGMELIQTYMARDFKVPVKFEDYAYVSQLVQAYGIKKAIEAHRRAMPKCMGTLYWQLNDCWPVISWSSVDYYNRWKVLHYFVRHAYQDVIISFKRSNDHLEVYVVSDRQEDFPATLKLKIMDFNGNIKWQTENQIDVSSSASEINSNVNLKGTSGTNHLIVARLIREDSVIAENLFYLLPVKDLDLPETKISKTITKTDSGFIIELTADKLAKNVYLNMNGEGYFSDNYFDLLPGETRKITCRSITDLQSFEKNLTITTLQSIYK